MQIGCKIVIRMYSFVAFAVYTSVTLRLIDMRTKGQTGPATKDGMIAYLPDGPGGGGYSIHYLYAYVPPNGVVILKLLI